MPISIDLCRNTFRKRITGKREENGNRECQYKSEAANKCVTLISTCIWLGLRAILTQLNMLDEQANQLLGREKLID